MCDGCQSFFSSKKGVIRAAAVSEANRFTEIEDLISDIYLLLQIQLEFLYYSEQICSELLDSAIFD